MKHILLVGHGEGCIGMKQSVEMILGEQHHLTAISLGVAEGPTDYLEKIENYLEKATANSTEVLILTDVYGGTPNNISVLASKKYSSVSVISGFHLGLILTACTGTDLSVSELLAETTPMIQQIV